MDSDDVSGAVVLGCLPSSPMLRSRCARALRLVHEERARRLFLTGTAAEADAMAACFDGAVAGGVEVVVDRLARRTLDNVRNARAFFGDEHVWLVTSRFHLPRALFLARHVGLRAHGVGDDGPTVRTGTLVREAVSWVGAVVDVALRR